MPTRRFALLWPGVVVVLDRVPHGVGPAWSAMDSIQQLEALKRSARNRFLAGRYGLVSVGADRLPRHKFQQIVETLDDLPPDLVRNGPIAGLSLGADLGLETYGETVDTSVAIGLVTCRGVGNRPHVIPGLTLFQATVVHEIGHTVAFADQRRLQTAFEHVFWPGDDRARGQGRPVSTYALLSASEGATPWSPLGASHGSNPPCSAGYRRSMSSPISGGVPPPAEARNDNLGAIPLSSIPSLLPARRAPRP